MHLKAREIFMLIDWRWIIIAIICALFGGLILHFGHSFQLTDPARSSISSAFFALVPVSVYIGHELERRKRENERRRQAVFTGIYLELLEFFEYIKDVEPNDKKAKPLLYIPPLSNTAWETACLSGYIRPDDEFCYKLRHIYEAKSNFIYLMNQAIEVQTKSILSQDMRKTMTSNMVNLLMNMNKSLVPFITEAKGELEKRSGISAEEVGRLQKDIKERALKFRLPSTESESA